MHSLGDALKLLGHHATILYHDHQLAHFQKPKVANAIERQILNEDFISGITFFFAGLI